MRRLLLAGLLAAVSAVPASAGQAACVSSGGVTACPQAVSRCSPNDTISVTATGVGVTGTVSCGGVTATCSTIRGTCTAAERVVSAGTLTCSASGSGAATCFVQIAAT